MKKVISIILVAILISSMGMPAFAVTEGSREYSIVVDTVEIPVISSIFDKISEIISKIYNFIINIIFPEEEPPGENEDPDAKIAITWIYLNEYGNWVEKTEYYENGEKLKVPSIAEKISEGGFSLRVDYFTGWSPELEEIVTKDMTYEAMYSTAW